MRSRCVGAAAVPRIGPAAPAAAGDQRRSATLDAAWLIERMGPLGSAPSIPSRASRAAVGALRVDLVGGIRLHGILGDGIGVARLKADRLPLRRDRARRICTDRAAPRIRLCCDTWQGC